MSIKELVEVAAVLPAELVRAGILPNKRDPVRPAVAAEEVFLLTGDLSSVLGRPERRMLLPPDYETTPIFSRDMLGVSRRMAGLQLPP